MPGCDQNDQRSTTAVDELVDLGGQATTRAADGVMNRLVVEAETRLRYPPTWGDGQILVIRPSPLCPGEQAGDCANLGVDPGPVLDLLRGVGH